MSDLAVTLTIEQLEAMIERAAERAMRKASGSAEPQEVLTREQAAKLLDVHPNVISRYVRDLGLPAHRVGGEWRLLRSEVLAWVASRELVAKGAA